MRGLWRQEWRGIGSWPRASRIRSASRSMQGSIRGERPLRKATVVVGAVLLVFGLCLYGAGILIGVLLFGFGDCLSCTGCCRRPPTPALGAGMAYRRAPGDVLIVGMTYHEAPALPLRAQDSCFGASPTGEQRFVDECPIGCGGQPSLPRGRVRMG